jgi:hypothetical protein
MTRDATCSRVESHRIKLPLTICLDCMLGGPKRASARVPETRDILAKDVTDNGLLDLPPLGKRVVRSGSLSTSTSNQFTPIPLAPTIFPRISYHRTRPDQMLRWHSLSNLIRMNINLWVLIAQV